LTYVPASGQSSTGVIQELGGVKAYISKPSDYPHAPARLLLLLTGGTGLTSTNNQIQADKFASEGFVVVMPDMFDGDPAPNSKASPEEAAAQNPTSTPSFLDTIKIKAVETAKSFLIDMWLARHTEEKVLPLLLKVIEAMKDEFADAVSHGDGIYAVGYCYGARYVLLLGAERASHPTGVTTPWSRTSAGDEEAGSPSKTVGPHIKVGALAHPTMVSKEDFVGLKVPVSLVCVENDPMLPDEVREAGEDYMNKNNVEHEVQVYPSVPHGMHPFLYLETDLRLTTRSGFAVVGEYDDENIKGAQSTAYDQMLNWLKAH
jgi:dienelactone hydrolase